MPTKGPVELEVRKIRKKLRAIERLEQLDRDLADEELLKVSRKSALRERLVELLPDLPEQTSINSTFDTTDPNTSQRTYDEDDEEVNPYSDESTDYHHYDYDRHYEADTDTPSEDTTQASSAEVSVTLTTSDEECTRPDMPFIPPEEAKEPDQLITMKRRPNEEMPTAPSTSHDNPKSKKAKSEAQHQQQKQKQNQSQGQPEKRKEQKKKNEPHTKLRSMKFQTIYLEGHNDLIYCVATDGEHIVTGSRDTMVKVWSATTGQELLSLGGHTGSISAVLLPSVIMAKNLGEMLPEMFDLDQESKVVISASQDCCFKIWHLKSGRLIKSVYTYNPIISLAFFDSTMMLVIGTGGGKVELWNMESGYAQQSLKEHDAAVTSLKVDASMLYSVSEDGVIKAYQLRDKTLHKVFASENITTTTGSPLPWRPIKSMVAANNVVYFGDDGMNVKALDWKLGKVHKLANHRIEFGATDAMCCYDNLLLSSGYDLDTALGYINVRMLPDEQYVGTLADEDTSRIMAVDCAHTKTGSLCIVTGGWEAKVWTQTSQSVRDTGEDVVVMKVDNFYVRTPEHSEVDSESDGLSDEPDSIDAGIRRRVRRAVSVDSAQNSWWSWCTLM